MFGVVGECAEHAVDIVGRLIHEVLADNLIQSFISHACHILVSILCCIRSAFLTIDGIGLFSFTGYRRTPHPYSHRPISADEINQWTKHHQRRIRIASATIAVMNAVPASASVTRITALQRVSTICQRLTGSAAATPSSVKSDCCIMLFAESTSCAPASK